MVDGLIKLSASSVKTYDQCPRKYKYTYIERMPRKEWEHFILGNLCHKTLELFHKSYLDSKNKGQPRSKLMKEAFILAQKDSGIRKEIVEEAFILLKDYLDSLAGLSIPNVKNIEVPFEFKINDNVIIRGVIDRVDELDDGSVRIMDYKTTKSVKYLEPFQLSVYGLWLQNRDPNIKQFKGSYVLLRHKSKTKDYVFNTKDLEKTQKTLLKYAQSIVGESIWSINPSPLCKYCDFNNICESQKEW